MKKGHVWAGIIGSVIAVLSLLGGIAILLNQQDSAHIKIAGTLSAAASVAFGLFLVSLYFKYKNREDAGQVPVKCEPNSHDDIVRLTGMRNWAIILVSFYEITMSVEAWAMNNYAAGLTLINMEMIFDLLANIVLFYFIVQLIRGKKVLKNILVTVAIMVVVEAIFGFLRKGVVVSLMDLAILPYFAYAIMSKVNRTHFRIAHMFILPATVVCVFMLNYVDGSKTQQIVINETRLENEYQAQTSVSAQAYTVFLQKNPPTSVDIKNVTDALTKSNSTVQQMFGLVSQMRAANAKQLPSINKEKVSMHLDNYEAFLNLNQQQADEMMQLMSYASSIDLGNLSNTQAEKLNAYEKDINNFSTLISDAGTKMSEEKSY